MYHVQTTVRTVPTMFVTLATLATMLLLDSVNLTAHQTSPDASSVVVLLMKLENVLDVIQILINSMEKVDVKFFVQLAPTGQHRMSVQIATRTVQHVTQTLELVSHVMVVSLLPEVQPDLIQIMLDNVRAMKIVQTPVLHANGMITVALELGSVEHVMLDLDLTTQ